MDERMDEPASWFQIRPGWKVYADDGSEVGEVSEVAGDETKDIFDGLALSTTVLGQPRYVPAEQVSTIRPGAVRLALSRQQVDALGEYLEPATSAAIEPDNRAGAGAEMAAEMREITGDVVRPVQSHAREMSIWRRMYLAVRRLVRR